MKYGLAFATASWGFVFFACPALAQNSAEANDTDEIVVTANRTESFASKTPLALTAMTGEALDEKGIETTAALADHVPNLTLATSYGGLQVTIRGVTNEDATERGDPSAAFLLDDVYIARPQAVEINLFDVSRVEVLRGPQGTLYGRNTTAGTINVITNRPTFEYEGYGELAIGDYSTKQATAVINVPITENFAVRAGVNYDERENFLEAGPALTGRINPFKENLAARLQALMTWDSGEVILRLDGAWLGGRPSDLAPLQNFYEPTVTGVDPRYIGGDAEQVLHSNAPITWDANRDSDTWGIGAQLTQSLGKMDLVYLASYRRFRRDDDDPRISADGTRAYRVEWDGDFKQQQHELRLATNGDGPLKAQVGAYYFEEVLRQQLHLLLVPNTYEIGNTVNSVSDPLTNTSYALYGQGTYALTDSLRATLGVRYSNDEKSRTNGYTQTCDRFDCSGTNTRTLTSIADVDFNKTTWRAGLDYDLAESTMLYGAVATGYKAGGFNDGCEAGTAPGCTVAASALYFEPEELTSYELGLKSALLDRALRFNVAAFKYDYKNMQLFQIIADCGGGASCSATTNAGEATVYGVELDGSYALTENDLFEFGATTLEAHFDTFAPDATHDFAGRPLGKSPNWTASAGYTHTFQLGNGGNFSLAAHSKFSDEYYLLSIATRNYYRQPSFSRTDASVTYNAPDDRWYVRAFVSNIEDNVPITTVLVGTRSSIQTQAAQTYGIRTAVRF